MLDENPAVRKVFEVFTLPLLDINEQNTKMNEGEKSQRYIQKNTWTSGLPKSGKMERLA
ncbi:MAG: hypothetical protein R2860_10785 [Desulfobacterales bacterium]